MGVQEVPNERSDITHGLGYGDSAGSSEGDRRLYPEPGVVIARDDSDPLAPAMVHTVNGEF